MWMEVGFPGGAAVEARFEGYTVRTDQPQYEGGGGTAPSPFDLFLASLATCAGYYVLMFCRARNLDTTGLALAMDADWDEKSHGVTAIDVRIRLPRGFPEKYRAAVVRAAEGCTVRRHLANPPEIRTTIE